MKEHRFELSDPPRELSWSLRTTVVLGGWTTVFAGVMFAFYAWLYAGAFLPESDVLSRIDFRGIKDRTVGVALGKEIADENSQNGIIMWRVRYAYTLGDSSYEGASYVSDVPPATARRCNAPHCVPGPPPPEPDSRVPVEYLREAPDRSRIAIEGFRRREQPEDFFNLLPQLPLFAFWLWTVAGGLRRRRLLAHGEAGEAKLVGKEPAGFPRAMLSGDFKLTFELAVPKKVRFGNHYRDPGEIRPASTHRFDVWVWKQDKEALLDDRGEPVLYDPRQPGNVVPLDALPGGVAPAEGRLVLRSRGRGLLAALAPLLAVAGYVYICGYLLWVAFV